MSKPLIGMNGDFRPARKEGGALSWFNTGYYDSILAVNDPQSLLRERRRILPRPFRHGLTRDYIQALRCNRLHIARHACSHVMVGNHL